MSRMTREDAIESFKKSVELCKARLDVEKMRMDIGEIKELEFYIERDEMAIQALEKENIYDDGEHYVTISKALYDKLNIDYDALSQEPCDYTGNEFFNFDAPMVKKSMEQDAISQKENSL